MNKHIARASILIVALAVGLEVRMLASVAILLVVIDTLGQHKAD